MCFAEPSQQGKRCGRTSVRTTQRHACTPRRRFELLLEWNPAANGVDACGRELASAGMSLHDPRSDRCGRGRRAFTCRPAPRGCRSLAGRVGRHEGGSRVGGELSRRNGRAGARRARRRERRHDRRLRHPERGEPLVGCDRALHRRARRRPRGRGPWGRLGTGRGGDGARAQRGSLANQRQHGRRQRTRYARSIDAWGSRTRTSR